MPDSNTINTQAVFGFADFLKFAAEREDPRLKTYWDIISKLASRPVCTFARRCPGIVTVIQSVYRMISFAQRPRRFGPSKNSRSRTSSSSSARMHMTGWFSTSDVAPRKLP